MRARYKGKGRNAATLVRGQRKCLCIQMLN
jgi:hypothetical protein